MGIADIASIRANVWKDVDTDSVGGKNLTRAAGATNNGPGDDLGLVTTGAANSYAEAIGYKPVYGSQGTWICRVKFPSGCGGGSSPWYTGDASANICVAFQGTWFIVAGNFCTCRTDLTNTWETLVGTWGPAGLKGYQNGTLKGTNAYTGTPATPFYDMTFGCLHYGGGYVQNISMTMDFAAYLTRQLSDAEVVDLTTTPSQLWAAAGGGIPGALARPIRQRCNRVRLVSRR